MNKGLIITLPQSDDVTEYLAIFSMPIINECKTRAIKFHEHIFFDNFFNKGGKYFGSEETSIKRD